MSSNPSSTGFRRTSFAQLVLDHGRRDRASREGRKGTTASPMFSAWTDGVFPPLIQDGSTAYFAAGGSLGRPVSQGAMRERLSWPERGHSSFS
jgi:hypothetical protein